MINYIRINYKNEKETGKEWKKLKKHLKKHLNKIPFIIYIYGKIIFSFCFVFSPGNVVERQDKLNDKFDQPKYK